MSPMNKLLFASALLACGAAQAALLPTTVTATGTYWNNVTLVNDGFVPPETTVWTSASNVYWNGTGVEFIFDLGGNALVRDILVSVDNNDSYLAQYSTDGVNWNALFVIDPDDGEIPVFPGGMDTLSSEAASLEYLPAMDFAGQIARYISFEAIGGDNSYALGELQVFGELAGTVPAPGTLLLLGAGLSALGFLRKKR